MNKRIWSIFFVICMLVFVCLQALRDPVPEAADTDGVSEKVQAGQLSKETESEIDEGEAEPEISSVFTDKKETVRLWYTDEVMTDYLQIKAEEYMSEHENIRLLPILVDRARYIESIYDASVKGSTDGMPDLFITTNDTLEKAYLSGVAKDISENESINEMNFPLTALDAVTYKGKKTAFPFSYKTAVFLYNKTHLTSMADSHNEALKDVAEAEAAMALTDALIENGGTPDESVTDDTFAADTDNNGDEYYEEDAEDANRPVTVQDLIPRSFEDILNIGDGYDAPEGLEYIFKWDVTDVFYNYFFAGNYMNIGGQCGDNADEVDICNPDSVACMEVFKALRQFFSIDAREVDYDKVMDEFIQGKILFTIASSDAPLVLGKAKAEGKLNFQPEVTLLPDLNDNLISGGLSVTDVIAVNGFTEKYDEAEDIARFLSLGADEKLYDMTGHAACNLSAEYDNDDMGYCMAAYQKSVSLPKIMEAGNFWMQLEIAMSRIWDGADTAETMEKLEDQIRSQLSGRQ